MPICPHASLPGFATEVTRHLTFKTVGCSMPSDETILCYALDTYQTIVSADSDFATMLALTGGHSPSLILLRSADHLNPDEQACLLLANLPAVAQDLDAGCVVSISRDHLRVRSLHIQR